jgi:LuxR family maltose regulon positive regulatory protein
MYHVDSLLQQQAGLSAYFGAAMVHIARGMLRVRDDQLTQAEEELARGTELMNKAQEVLQACVDPGILSQLVANAERELRLKARPTSHVPYPVELSDRVLAVLLLLRTDLTQREIGDQLYVSFNTVKSHTKSIFLKLDVSTRRDAIARARDLGLL